MIIAVVALLVIIILIMLMGPDDFMESAGGCLRFIFGAIVWLVIAFVVYVIFFSS